MHRHTLLVNLVLGMCSRARGQTSLLADHGYHICAAETRVRVGDRDVVPDIMFLNEKAGHILVVDCKGGANVKSDQDRRYSRMALREVVRSARPRCEVRSHTFAYAIVEEHEGRIYAHTSHALIVFGRRSVRGIGDFGLSPLTRALRAGASLKDATHVRSPAYPFSINDSHEDIDAHVGFGASLYLDTRPSAELRPNRDTAREIFRALHPLHSSYSPAHTAELVEVTRLSIARMLSRPGWADRVHAAHELDLP